MVSLGVIILAAGASSRMGKSKMLLEWGSTTVIGHLVSVWKELGARQVAVVCATGGSELHSELDRLGLPITLRVLNPKPEQGMFSSIQCAARWRLWDAGLTHWVIALGDQPHVSSQSLRALIDFAARRPDEICQPSYHAHPRHPVLLPKRVFHELAESDEDDLKQFLQMRLADLNLIEIDDPGLDLDIDRPEDYERALKLAFTNIGSA